MKKNSKISIITVVFNDKLGLQRTIESVIALEYDDVEFIVIDGDSIDGTIEIIKKYEKYITYWISEKDNGIYAAMNKGIKVATGDWVNFMNAGDCFIGSMVLNQLDFISNCDADIIYGYKKQNNQLVYPLNVKNLEIGLMFGNHQSMFFNKCQLDDDLYYDEQYKIYADYELVNRIYLKAGCIMQYRNLVITDYEGMGISSRPSMQKRIDKYRIVFKYYGFSGLIKALYYSLFNLHIN